MSPVLLRVADLAVAAGRGAWGRLPPRLRKGLEDRVFYAIFQVTRVENDAYGWRPDAPSGDAPPGRPAAPHDTRRP